MGGLRTSYFLPCSGSDMTNLSLHESQKQPLAGEQLTTRAVFCANARDIASTSFGEIWLVPKGKQNRKKGWVNSVSRHGFAHPTFRDSQWQFCIPRMKRPE